MKTRKLLLLAFALLSAVLIGCESGSSPSKEESNSAATAVPSPSAVPSLTALPQPTATQETLDPTNRESNNIAAFGRLYALVRYFHPSDEVAGIEAWDNFLMNGITAVRDAQTPIELREQLNHYFGYIAPTVQVYLKEDGPPEPAVSLPPSTASLEVVMWEHYGVQADSSNSPYSSRRVHAPLQDGQIFEGFRDPQQPYTADLGSGVMAAVPVSLFQNNNGTLPAVPEIPAEILAQPEPDLQTQYLAANIMYWSVIRHFYPYLDVIDTDWEAVLPQAISKTLAAGSEIELEDNLFWLVAQSQDGHGYLANSRFGNYNIPSLLTVWVENELVITGDLRPIAAPLLPGTQILTIDGEVTQARFERFYTLAPGATSQFRTYLTEQVLLAEERLTRLELEIQDPDGNVYAITIPCTNNFGSLPNLPHPYTIKELEAGIYYVDLSQINDSDFDAALPDLETAEGIIFDMRGYPAVSLNVLRHLISSPVSSAHFLIPETRLPNQEDVTYDDGSWELVPLEPKLTDNIVFLTNGSAISYAETWMGIVEHYQLGEIVGEPTAGTNGNVNTIDLPTGHTVSWTGMLTLKQDGSQHHGVGIQPTHPVSLTIEGIRDGRDEQLEAALALLKD